MFDWHNWLEGVSEEDILLAVSYLQDGKIEEEIGNIFWRSNGGLYGAHQTVALVEEAKKRFQDSSVAGVAN